MGYAIFTARKLMLTNRINQMNFRLMQLTQQQQTLSDRAAQMERAIAANRNLFSNMANMFQMGMQQMQNTTMYQLGLQNMAQGGMGDMSSIGSLLGGFNGFNMMNNPMTLTLNYIQQQQQLVSENNMRQVKEQENQIELQRKSLETQLAAAQKELEKVEEAEQKNIDRSAPKFA